MALAAEPRCSALSLVGQPRFAVADSAALPAATVDAEAVGRRVARALGTITCRREVVVGGCAQMATVVAYDGAGRVRPKGRRGRLSFAVAGAQFTVLCADVARPYV